MSQIYNEDDYCDLYQKKICDNCGRCLENEGVDIKAIKIEEISKNIEQNEFLEEEYKKELNLMEEDIFDMEESEKIKNAYKKLKEDPLFRSLDIEYEDAFDHIEYIDDVDFSDENTLEEMTIEIFPGVRQIKNIKK